MTGNRVLKFLLHQIHPLLAALEKRLQRRWLENPLTQGPVFIVAPPRSGTTLVYQLLAHCFNFSYFTNFSARLYLAPALAAWLQQPIQKLAKQVHDSDQYSSEFGQTSGWLGPNEGGPFWYRWFPKDGNIYVPPGTTSAEHLLEMRLEVSGWEKLTHQAVLFKNTYNSLRIAPLVEAFPRASFLVVQRDPLDVSQSILHARLKVNGNPQTWWALPPKEFEQIKDLPYWEQIPAQVYYIEKQISADRALFGADRFFTVEYARLCQTPEIVLSEVAGFLMGRGISLNQVSKFPSPLPISIGRKVNEPDYMRLNETVKTLWYVNH